MARPHRFVGRLDIGTDGTLWAYLETDSIEERRRLVDLPSYGVVMNPDAGWALSGWCEGAGTYEGLRAFIRWDTTPGDMWFDVPGFITSGDPPPMPEAPAS